MVVKQLLELLHDIPLNADIFVDRDGDLSGDVAIEPVTDECHGNVIAYIICDRVQLSLDYDETKVKQ